ncbi:MAG: hypothetical protein RR846_07400 [Oscillospiraceae bacterium]
MFFMGGNSPPPYRPLKISSEKHTIIHGFYGKKAPISPTHGIQKNKVISAIVKSYTGYPVKKPLTMALFVVKCNKFVICNKTGRKIKFKGGKLPYKIDARNE